MKNPMTKSEAVRHALDYANSSLHRCYIYLTPKDGYTWRVATTPVHASWKHVGTAHPMRRQSAGDAQQAQER